MIWRWRTDEERYKAIENETIETTSLNVIYVHPEEVMQCLWETKTPEHEKIIAKCPHYERDWEYDPEDWLYCCCRHFWAMGFKGVCEKTIIEDK